MPYRHPRALARCERPKTIGRFFSYIDIHPGCSCWKWTGHLNSHGYGHYRCGGKLTYAHRFSYALFNNGVPEGMTVDHICGNARCVNPEHLQLATSEDNAAKGKGYEKDVETEKLPGVGGDPVVDCGDLPPIPF